MIHVEFRAGIIVADAGCILETLSEYLAPHNYIMQLDLGAKGRYAPYAVDYMALSTIIPQLSNRWKCVHKRRRLASTPLRLTSWLGSGP